MNLFDVSTNLEGEQGGFRGRRLLKHAELHVCRDVELWYADARSWGESQDILQGLRRSLVRAHAINISSVIAIPAEQPQIARESEFNDNDIPAATRDTVDTVAASGIGVAVPLAVVNSQELLNGFPTTDTRITVVGEDDGLISCCLAPLPVEPIFPPSTVSSVCVGTRLDSASLTQPTPATSTTLDAYAGLTPSFTPCATALFALHEDRL